MENEFASVLSTFFNKESLISGLFVVGATYAATYGFYRLSCAHDERQKRKIGLDLVDYEYRIEDNPE
jgi:hypothetical protein